METLTLQVHVEGRWHDAALLTLGDAARGTDSPSSLAYDTNYYFAYGHQALAQGCALRDHRAISVRYPLDLESRRIKTWPPFLLDLLPQGKAKERLCQDLGIDASSKSAELPLLVRSAGSPIGNLRVKEAWQKEQERLEGVSIQGVTIDEIFAHSEVFGDMVDRFALLASGSSGVQGEWPKILLTQAKDELFYPDSIVADEDARAHVIVKMSQAKFPEDLLILEAEAPYLELARNFGLRVGAPLTHQSGVLVIPRFDREIVSAQSVTRHGQESLVSGLGVAAFGHITTHEQYIRILAKHCSEPQVEIVEYVLRDLLSRAMGDSDNHGRNTALQKRVDGSVRLTPLYDFAPMSIHPSMIRPSTSWDCLRGVRPASRYALICTAVEQVSEQSGIAALLRGALLSKIDWLSKLPSLAAQYGVSQVVIQRALRSVPDVVEDLRKLEQVRSVDEAGR